MKPALIMTVTTFALAYLLGVFFHAEFDMTLWSADSRGVMLLCAGILVAVATPSTSQTSDYDIGEHNDYD